MNLSAKYSKVVAFASALILTGSTLTLIPTSEVSAVTSDYNYAKGLQYSMYLYDGNMCGTGVDENSAFDWRGDCHTNDTTATSPSGTTVDVSGGYHDAGDHVKFGLPQAYSASVLGWSYYEFKDAFTQTGQSDHMKTISTYFADYFKNCTVMDSSGNVTAFCYQVGDGTSDHDEWCAPEDQNIDRPTYWATSSNPATDIVANTVGALAFNYANFGDTESLTYAKALYAFAKKNSKQVASQGVSGFYDSDSYIDDLMWAAAALYTVTGDKSYVSDANTFLNDYGNTYAFCSDWPLCWGNMWPIVNLIFSQTSGITNQYGSLQSDMKSQVEKTMTSFQSKTTLDGTYVCFDDWGSTRYNTAMQLVGLAYDKYYNTDKYSSWAKSQMDYILGDNSQNLCYIIGYDDNSVTNAHHRAASGLSDFPTENTTITMGHLLTGAMVGGPMKDGSYNDYVSSYKYTEVTLDYNASLVGAMAGLYLKYGSGQQVDSTVNGVGATSSSTTTTTTTEATTTTTEVTTTTTEPVTTTSAPTTTTSTNKVTSTSVTNSSQTVATTTEPVVTTTAEPVTSESIATSNVNETLSSGGTLTIPLNTIMKDGDKVSKISVDVSSVSGDVVYVSGQIAIDSTSGQLTTDLPQLGTSSATIDIEIGEGTTLNADGNLTINLWWASTPITVDNVSAEMVTTVETTTVATTTAPAYTTSINTVSDTNYTTTTTTTATTTASNLIIGTPQLSQGTDSDVLIATLQPSSTGKVTVTITGGTPNASISGQLGYWDSTNNVWVNIPWDTTGNGLNLDSNGNLTISDIEVPVNQGDVQLQVTYYSDWTSGTENVLDKSSLSVSVLESGSTAATTTTATASTNSTNQQQTQATTTPVTTTYSNQQTNYTTTTANTTTAGNSQNTQQTNATTTTATNSNNTNSSNTKGDANCDGDVLANDLTLVKKHLLGISILSGQGFNNADINGDGDIQANDLLLLKKYILGIVSSL
jgi:hypothetical protein